MKPCECGCGGHTKPAPHTDKSLGWVKGQPLRYINGHNRRRSKSERFWEKVNKDGCGGCWEWTGCVVSTGYGQFNAGKPVYAHRFAYELLVGPIPEGLVINHICRVRHCVNPDHLEAISNKENILCGEGATAKNAKRTHCPQGHPYSGDNLYLHPTTGHRSCRTCNRLRHRKEEGLSELTKAIVYEADAIFTAQHQQAKRLAEYRRLNESRS